MFSAIKSIFSPPTYQLEAHALYVRIVERARDPKFYTDYDVPDTVDGRFDMIALHLFFVGDRLKNIGSEEALLLLRALNEAFFADMDRSLREMGSTDTGVGKRMKNISQAFYGRQFAYQQAGDDAQKWQEALLRNLYRGDLEKLTHAAKMADVALAQMAEYKKLALNDIVLS